MSRYRAGRARILDGAPLILQSALCATLMTIVPGLSVDAFAATHFGCPTVPTPYPHPLHPPVSLSSDDRQVADELAFYQRSRGIDFAGRFTLAQIGCGAGCLRLVAVDGRSGRIHWFGKTLSDWPIGIRMPLAYHANSQMLGMLGALDEHGDTGWHWFTFDGRAFVPADDLPPSCRPAPLPPE